MKNEIINEIKSIAEKRKIMSIDIYSGNDGWHLDAPNFHLLSTAMEDFDHNINELFKCGEISDYAIYELNRDEYDKQIVSADNSLYKISIDEFWENDNGEIAVIIQLKLPNNIYDSMTTDNNDLNLSIYYETGNIVNFKF